MYKNYKVPQRRVYLEMNRMKRGKPHKWETQILVGELFEENKNLRMDG